MIFLKIKIKIKKKSGLYDYKNWSTLSLECNEEAKDY